MRSGALGAESSLSSPASASRAAGSRGGWMVPGICVSLAVMTWLVFGQTIHFKFVNFDDNLYVQENPVVQQGLTLKGIVWAFTDVHSFNWHPLTWFSHMLDCQFYGLNPGGHHFTNVLLHTTTVILLFLVLRQLTGALWRSAFVAAVFAVHPLRAESVAWVAERKDVLSGLFFMLTIAAYVRYARHPWSPARYGLVMFLFALGLMCKPMLVTLPFVLLLLDYWPLNRLRADGVTEPVFRLAGWPVSRRLILEKLPLLGLAAALGVATLFTQKQAIQSLPLFWRIGNALVAYVVYLRQMIYPVGLAVYYPHPGSSLPFWEMIAALVLLLAISAGAAAVRRKYPWFLFGWLWYLGMLIPTIGILQVGAQAQADRYTYLPQIGLYVMLTWMAADLCIRWRHRRLVLGGLSTAILVALTFCARTQTAYWRNSESLWTRALACTSDNAIALGNLGSALLQKGSVDEAITDFQKVLQIKPDDTDACVNLGSALLQKGRVDEAITHFQRALQIKPDITAAHNNLGNALLQKGSTDEAIAHFQKALQIKADHTEAHIDLGNALLQKGKVDEAIASFQKALQIRPDHADAHYNLGNALFQEDRVDEAITHFQRALQIRPDYANARVNFGNALLRKGAVDEAIAQYQKVLQIKPDHADAHYNLGNALLQKGRMNEAAAHFQKAVQIKPDYAKACYNLGNALLQTGKVNEAVAAYRKALQIKPDYPEAQNDLAWVLATAPQAFLRNGNQAVELAQQANRVAGGENPNVLGTLAAAYAEAGRFAEARQSVQKAIALARAAGRPDMVEQLNGELKCFEAGRPFRQDNQ